MSAPPRTAGGPRTTERRERLVDALARDGRIDVARAVAALGVTHETVRKDLVELERLGLLRRVHGGALPVGLRTYEPAVSARSGQAAAKDAIALAALAHVPDGGSVLLDAGSTTARLAALLPADRDLLVCTGVLPVAVSLLDRPRISVVTLGGAVRPRTHAEVGDWALRSLAEINVDVAFLGTNGIDVERGLTTPDPLEAAVKRAMPRAAQRAVLLADATTVGAVSRCRFAELADVDLLVTDTGLDPERAQELRAAGLAVETA